MQAIPILALVPIIGSIFGFDIPSRILVCVLIAMFPIVNNTLFGLLSAERGQHDLFTLHRVSRWYSAAQAATSQRDADDLRRLPHRCRPVGHRRDRRRDLLQAWRQGGRHPARLVPVAAQFPQMYGALILAAALGIAVFILFGWLGNLVVGRWYEPTRKSG